MKTDQFDKHILRLVQQNNRLTAEELADMVGLSPSAVQRRLKRLREEKIIEADVSIVSPKAGGIEVTCIVDVILERGSSQMIEKFKLAMQQLSEVMQCYYVTGTYDFIMIVNTLSMQQYEEFTKKWLMDNPNVKHFYTHVVMDKVKVGYSIAI
ncbi:Lrp/AsnC family transcriptional regulator [Mucilaginibacter sp. OK098]|uniref:Lrp/AsnC family transcriptional regulator n=1 Tax=Mucilaginibacter sp. OK098 TaxID=1855297 RepID=UPI0009208E48|nr:Lrp/AsnC family transcriptional regulator [Mucilaginibacter sp. OK098]SHN31052.1 transcriptional regulator, AsnC family [Mucilaginibacter sp. OK098]